MRKLNCPNIFEVTSGCALQVGCLFRACVLQLTTDLFEDVHGPEERSKRHASIVHPTYAHRDPDDHGKDPTPKICSQTAHQLEQCWRASEIICTHMLVHQARPHVDRLMLQVGGRVARPRYP